MSGFSRGIQEIHKGNLLAPVLRGELLSPRFRSFTIKVEKWTTRPPDGWFHPSTHSTWPARKLALMVRHPELFIDEEPTLEKVIAVTQGHFFHTFSGKIFKRNGIIPELEIGFEDPEHNRKGHMDGKLTNGEGWEFKTVNQEFLLKKIFDIETLIKYKPGYYGQAQDYIDVHELDAMRFLMMGVFYPYPMTEFLIPRDDIYIRKQRAKYREAMDHFQRGSGLPERCCELRSTEAKSCEMAHGCNVGRAALGMPAMRGVS